MKRIKLRYKIVLFFLLVCSYSTSQNYGGEGPVTRQDSPCLTVEQRQEVFNLLSKSKETLKSNGLYRSSYSNQAITFIFPVEQAEGFNYESTWGISNYVDHNPNINALTDYNCGTKTYDTQSGYHHQGVDIFTWPFSWNQLENNQTKIVAAASGQIIYKSDGNFDRNCSFNNDLWNAVYIEHADGSIAWYGHMKKGSLTTKNVGDMVSQGEFLGIIGSSGNSTGPHLHFEVYDANNRLIDPYSGPCNTFNSSSWWENQKDYENPKINAILTHSQVPTFPQCPNTEDLFIKNNFDVNESIIFASYFVDQQPETTANYSIYTPTGALFTSWTNNFQNYYFSSYWYQTIQVNGEEGVWTYEATYNNKTVSHDFTVGNITSQTAYKTHNIPGIIQAEAYDNGGQGVAYNDLDSVNRGRQGRLNEGVDIQNANDNGGGTNIGWTANGEWLEYTINNIEDGTYNLYFRVASNNSNPKSIAAILDGVDLGTIAINNTGGWQNWATVKLTNLNLTGGTNKVLRLTINGGGFNLNHVDFKKVIPQTNGAPIGKYISLQKSRGDQLFVAAENGNNRLIADRTAVRSWEKFLVETHPDGGIALKANVNNLYVRVPGFDTNAAVQPRGQRKGKQEQFEWKSMGQGKVAIRSVYTGRWLQAPWTENNTIVRARGVDSRGWETFNWKRELLEARKTNNIANSKTENTSFKLYPNPASDKINIKLSEQLLTKETILTLIDGLGRTIRTVAMNQEHESIDVSNLTSGLYFIKIIGNDKVMHKTFLKR